MVNKTFDFLLENECILGIMKNKKNYNIYVLKLCPGRDIIDPILLSGHWSVSDKIRQLMGR